jgi:predicted transcriptional regulator
MHVTLDQSANLTSSTEGHKMDDDSNHPELLSLTTKIVASHAGSNKLAVSELPALIARVFEALRTVGTVAVEKPVEALMPAVPIRKSVTPEFIVCLEDGKKLKMLKRHLRTRYHMSPEEYRKRWGLPRDYPMVAPAYAAQRSSVAKRIGLGRKAVAPVPQPPEPPPAPTEPPRRAVGRKKAAA